MTKDSRYTDLVIEIDSDHPMQPVDLLILSNGPGEVMTWVRPVVKAIRAVLGEDRALVRISVVLSPCPHASGEETKVLRSYTEVDRIQEREDFWNFLLWGKTAANWDWHNQGVVIFLGGDQVFPLIIGKRLGYRTVIYAEWDARWVSFLDCYGARNTLVRERVSAKYRHKVQVIGDLMVDLDTQQIPYNAQSSLIGLMVGSKGNKLPIGVPFCLAIAEILHSLAPQTEFIIPLAPTVNLEMIAYYANPEQNPLIEKVKGTSAKLMYSESPYLETNSGLKVKLLTSFPAYDFLMQCSLVVTTVGANTAELAALGIPMWVLLPTQQIDTMRAAEGLPGFLTRLPLVGKSFATLINNWIFRHRKLYAWPNIWAEEEIVPERAGLLTPEEIALEIAEYLKKPEQLKQIRAKLEQIRGKSGAAKELANLIQQQIKLGYTKMTR